jgi:acetyltransferase-like isoleucine patch superfamily enzyme
MLAAVSKPVRRVLTDLGARVKLRRCAFVGPATTVLGRVWVHGKGRVHVAQGVVLDARAAPIELCAHPGAEIRIGPGVRIEGGASVEAVSRIVIGAGARLGSFCKLLDNHFHVLGRERHRRPPSRPVAVGEGAEIGARAILLPGAWVGSQTVVPSGAVVSRRLGPAGAAPGGRELADGTPVREPDPDKEGHHLLRKLRVAKGILRAAWYLRGCELGRRVRAGGRVHVANEGTVRIGAHAIFLGGMIPTAIVCRRGASIEVGANATFNYGSSLEACQSIRIGSGCMFGSMVRVSDRGKAGARPVVIGDNVWIAHGAIIEPGAIIGAGSVVAAGSVVSTEVPPESLAIGNPARCMSLGLRSDEMREGGTAGAAQGTDIP